ncbi:posphoenolpyruvate synthetase regulatory kinase/phosphorylase PpsR [Inmirania thermothiophila]|uniref:Putative phosphoenolpyruvate synthase regulatory protein n=1 Tax=Inmirania thermothiophila TaxID=1750597 RepID=A0A3N1YAD7_9GAMM|nr:pyruvate, water dikinase regulatory protein [Inmirania thermothiophila]ROR34592.1 hypothetical protein EDC57_0490 [Inmirania thermothiophila]
MAQGTEARPTPRPVFFVSDRTGITAETLGHSLLSQFEGVDFQPRTIPFVDTVEKARAAAAEIDRAAAASGVRPLVFSTLVDAEIRRTVAASRGVCFDFFDAFIGPLEREFATRSSHTIGRTHGLVDLQAYQARIEAVNYALTHDDGLGTGGYDRADLILTGVSRSGKTPTSLYLAMHFGVRAANYPLTEEDLEQARLPEELAPHRDRIYGLTIDPERLAQIRAERRPGSRYASLEQCRREIRQVERLYRMEGIPAFDTSRSSIEEIATAVIERAGIRRRLF